MLIVPLPTQVAQSFFIASPFHVICTELYHPQPLCLCSHFVYITSSSLARWVKWTCCWNYFYTWAFIAGLQLNLTSLVGRRRPMLMSCLDENKCVRLSWRMAKGERDFLRQLPATYLGKNSSNSTLHVSHSKTSKTSSFARAFSSSCCCLSFPSTNTLQLYRTRIYCESFYGWKTSQGCRGRLRAIKETCCESFWVNKSRGRMLEFNPQAH